MPVTPVEGGRVEYRALLAPPRHQGEGTCEGTLRLSGSCPYMEMWTEFRASCGLGRVTVANVSLISYSTYMVIGFGHGYSTRIWYKQWKVQRVVLKNLPKGGPKGNQTFLRGAAPKESLII